MAVEELSRELTGKRVQGEQGTSHEEKRQDGKDDEAPIAGSDFGQERHGKGILGGGKENICCPQRRNNKSSD